MPVDFTKKNGKSNIAYLTDLISDHMPQLNKEEAIEFLSAIQDEKNNLEQKTINLLEEFEGEGFDVVFSHTETPCTINAGIGYIEYYTDNVQLQQVMEALEDAIKKESPSDIIHRLTGDWE